ncbi:YihY/virulence factor BrkB family protein [Novosphingobium sp. Chol11]|uniref:YihY/virulence factor BrkB family protein n=1 Tax=Novosphingobium sp. Chol11 TaxID=1385763 RepID=UPI000BE2F8D5|nr:YihY/virulence factor BrkB family protein [Novosphingobium sp. Chol11]
MQRAWVNSGRHNLSLLSAGVAFYAFLSFVPLLGSLVMTYGLVADPATVAKHMRAIVDLVPADAARLIYEQLTQLTQSAAEKKGIGLLLALAVSIYGASRASGAMIGSLNIIYEQEDRRSLIRTALIAAALAAGAVIVGLIGIVAASMLNFAQGLVEGLGTVGAVALQAITWTIAAALCSLALGAMYRFAPDRADARWQWLSLGSGLATLLWLLTTLGFGLYASWLGDYDATYGSLAAVVVLLMWLYVSAYAVLIGALVNAEVERQTSRDTTTGPEEPMGERGATMADTSAALDQ